MSKRKRTGNLPVIAMDDHASRGALEAPIIEAAMRNAQRLADVLALALSYPFGPERRALLRVAAREHGLADALSGAIAYKTPEEGFRGVAYYEEDEWPDTYNLPPEDPRHRRAMRIAHKAQAKWDRWASRKIAEDRHAIAREEAERMRLGEQQGLARLGGER